MKTEVREATPPPVRSGGWPEPEGTGAIPPQKYRDSNGNFLFDEGFWYPRIKTVLAVAEALGRPLSRGELLDLLPPTPSLDRETFLGQVLEMLDPRQDGGIPGFQREAGSDLVANEERTRSRLNDATRFVESLPPVFRECLSLAAVTGSTAYGNPAPGDDIDLFLVAREGGLWLLLLGAFLHQRMRRRIPGGRASTEYCLNFALEERVLYQEFLAPQGFLFARETLMMRPVLGGALLRRILEECPWLQREIPGLYARRLRELPSGPPPKRPLGKALQLVNSLLFPWLAAYLQGKGLWENHRHRREGRSGSTFRLETNLRRFALRSRKYDHLIALYGSGLGFPDGSGPSERGHAPGGAHPRGPRAGQDPPERSTRGGTSPDERFPPRPSRGSEKPTLDP